MKNVSQRVDNVFQRLIQMLQKALKTKYNVSLRYSYRKTQEKRHWPCNTGDECVLSHEGVTNTFKLKELLNDKEDKETP